MDMLQHLRALFSKIPLASKTNTGLLGDADGDAETATSESMQKFAAVTPIFRIFDEHKAREFYTGFLGATTVFEHRFWPAPSKWSNPNVRIGFGFERRHAALPL